MQAHYIKFLSLPTWERFQLCILEWYQLKLNKKDLYYFWQFHFETTGKHFVIWKTWQYLKKNNVKNVYLIQGGRCQRKQWKVGTVFFEVAFRIKPMAFEMVVSHCSSSRGNQQPVHVWDICYMTNSHVNFFPASRLPSFSLSLSLWLMLSCVTIFCQGHLLLASRL